MSGTKDIRTYLRSECAVFRKTAEAFGGLSNMAPGFPVRVNGERILTVEALYQACRFPHRPEVQRLILDQSSPMTAKMVSKPYRKDSRADWNRVRVSVMRWCLRLKLAQHWSKFSQLLLSTGTLPIVEDSRKDDFWGAIPSDSKTLVGRNVLGRLLMELRDGIEKGVELRCIAPPEIPQFLLFGEPLQIVDFRADKSAPLPAPAISQQLPLFDDTLAMTPKARKPEVRSTPSSKKENAVIADLKPYPEIKESGLPWLGKVPKHWEIKRAKSIFECVDQRSNTGKEELLTVSSARGVVPRKSANVTMFKAESYLGYKLCWPGDLVINSLWAWAGGLGVSKHHGIISSAYGVYRIRQDAPMIPAFVNEVARSSSFSWELKVRSKGVWISRLQLTDISFLDAPMHIPPVEEQAAIVRFLDWANGRLERTIRAKRKVIALLNEQKQAIIHRAVTRGLDPNVPLKDSGIPWLGMIPAHWEVRKLRHLTRQIIDGTHFTPAYKDDGMAFLRVTDIHEREIDESRLRRISKQEYLQLNKRCNPEKGDLLLSKNGTIGVTKVVDWDFPFSIFVSLCLIKPIKSLINSHFISFAFSGGLLAQQLADTTKTTSVTNLHLDKIRTLILPLPPLEEQSDILEKTQEEIAPVEIATTRLEQEIELLREYRTRLVADVVTGKLDVRAAAKNLPILGNEPLDSEELAEQPDDGFSVDDDEPPNE